MERIYLCFVWHMHQPCYKDLVSGEYRLPWTRMHALKDYYGMVKILSSFPAVHQTFNLVPSLLMQVEEYASGLAADPFLRLALKPAEDLTEADTKIILQYFFQANTIHLIGRYPRYAELYEAWRAGDRNFKHAQKVFNRTALRDLQVLSQLAWFEEEFLENDPAVRELAAKGRDYTLSDQQVMGEKQLEILGKVLPVYRDFAATGQIEISATPYYHPILPLLCDSEIARESNPGVPLPARFRYPQDARLQLERSVTYMKEKVGIRPRGMWPSEGSVSDEALGIAAECGFEWAATDNGVLARTLGRIADAGTTYRPYLWKRDGRQMHMLFRDHHLSDLVGFVYSKMDAAAAAQDFLNRIKENTKGLVGAGRDVLVPIILDGENAWEHYYLNGRPFLSELYHRISNDSRMQAVTVSEALERVPSQEISRIFPGSWISANFDVWIGFEEDNRAWEYLLRARQAYDNADLTRISKENVELALEELLIAEGSDWCWWYGPHHHSENRLEFDQLFRDHLANVYRALNLPPPSDLSRPILRTFQREFHQKPVSKVSPRIDGEITSYFEWMGAGVFKVDARSGAMHGQRFLVRQVSYGVDASNLYLRVDFGEALKEAELRIAFDSGASVRVALAEARAEILSGGETAAKAAYRKVAEVAIPLPRQDQPVRIQVSLWQGGLPMDALPQEGWLEITPREFLDWAD